MKPLDKAKRAEVIERALSLPGIPGLWRGEPEFVYNLAWQAPDGPSMEIGVRNGHSLMIWGPARVGRGPLYGIEIHDKPLMRKNLAKSGLPVEIIIGDSCEVALAISELAFLFVDGDHTARGIWQDIVRFTPLIIPGGIVVFHDYGVPAKKAPLTRVKPLVRLWHEAFGWEKLGREHYAAAFRRPGHA